MNLVLNKNIWLVGVSGVGKSTFVENFKDILFHYLSLSSFVREETVKKNLVPHRENFAFVSWELRKTLGNDYLAKLAYNVIRGNNDFYIIDGIRHPEEIEYLRGHMYIDFIGIIVEDKKDLTARILNRKRPTDILKVDNILKSINREYSSDIMNVKKCLELSNIIISNNWTLEEFKTKISILMHDYIV